MDVAMALTGRVSRCRRLPGLEERVGALNVEGRPGNGKVAGASMGGRSDLGTVFQLLKLQLPQEQ